MYDHQLIFTVVSFECGFIKGGKTVKPCQTMFIIFIMPSSDVFHQWGDMINYKLWDGQWGSWFWNNDLPHRVGSKLYRCPMAGCPKLYSQVGRMFITNVPGHNPSVPRFSSAEASGTFKSSLLTMVSNFTRVGTIIGEAFQRFVEWFVLTFAPTQRYCFERSPTRDISEYIHHKS